MIYTLEGIEEAILATWCDDPSYAKTLCGPRTRGSTTDRPLFVMKENGPILTVENRPVKHEGPGANGAQIYTARIPEIGGRLGAKSLDDLSDEELAQVQLRRGDHGVELFLPNSNHNDRPRTDVVTFIVGPQGDLWTWFPGRVLDPLSPNTAVKLV